MSRWYSPRLPVDNQKWCFVLVDDDDDNDDDEDDDNNLDKNPSGKKVNHGEHPSP